MDNLTLRDLRFYTLVINYLKMKKPITLDRLSNYL